jgi:hypothetical protein
MRGDTVLDEVLPAVMCATRDIIINLDLISVIR